jgi:hypothetical protein
MREYTVLDHAGCFLPVHAPYRQAISVDSPLLFANRMPRCREQPFLLGRSLAERLILEWINDDMRISAVERAMPHTGGNDRTLGHGECYTDGLMPGAA